MTSRLEPGAEHAIRVRLEGRLETIEELTRRWRDIAQTLRADGWQTQIEFLNEPSDGGESLTEARAALTRVPESFGFLRQLDAARAEANEWAAKRFRELGFSQVPGVSAVKQLQALGPIRYHAKRIAPTGLIGLAGSATGVVAALGANVGLMLSVAIAGGVMLGLRLHYGARRFLTVTDRLISISGEVIALEAINSALVVRKKVEGGRSQGHGELTFQLTNGGTHSLALWEDPAPLLLLLKVKGVYAKVKFQIVPPSGD